MRSARPWLASTLFALSLLIGTRALAQPVEGIAALVGGTTPGPGTAVILRSDVELRARIALAGQTEQIPVGMLPPALLAAALDEMLGEVLIAREADRLRAVRPATAEVARERLRVEQEAGGALRLTALLQAIGGSPQEVDAIARRRAYVNAFLRANLEGSTVIADGQVERAYEAGEHPFAALPLEEAREPLRAWLAQRALQRDVRRWVEVLRSRTTVRVLAEWERGQDDGG